MFPFTTEANAVPATLPGHHIVDMEAAPRREAEIGRSNRQARIENHCRRRSGSQAERTVLLAARQLLCAEVEIRKAKVVHEGGERTRQADDALVCPTLLKKPA